MRVMGINATGNITTGTDVYAAYGAATAAKADSSSKADTTSKAEETEGVVYDKSDSTTDTSKATYSVNKMSAEDRAALVSQLKADEESRRSQLTSLVQQMLGKQASTYATASSTDIWQFLASGDYTVDEAAKAQAQQDISEDGYYGVKQTSERLFDFASALAGDDVDKMKEMQEAMEEGFKQATAAWGKDLPDICQQTLDAANKMFEDYYASKGSDTED
jgi:hypothetical protein